jgi:hypothetical protein
MSDYSDAEALRRVNEIWRWAIKAKRPYFAYLVAAAILAFDMDGGPGNFDPPGTTKGLAVDVLKKPRRGRPPKKRI